MTTTATATFLLCYNYSVVASLVLIVRTVCIEPNTRVFAHKFDETKSIVLSREIGVTFFIAKAFKMQN